MTSIDDELVKAMSDHLEKVGELMDSMDRVDCHLGDIAGSLTSIANSLDDIKRMICGTQSSVLMRRP